jgi:phage recombination protein Bet
MNTPLPQFTPEQIEIIKNTVAVGVSDGELALFLEVCKSMNLNPFKRQIHAVVRKSKRKNEHGDWIEEAKMVIQTGIDGYRKTAANTGLHSGTSDPEYGPEVNGFPSWAKVTVKKLLPSGRDAEFTATARWTEYVQTTKDYKTGSLTPNSQWLKMPYHMLGKCAEALALRKAFPDELSGVYTEEEMGQADSFQPDQPLRPAAVTLQTLGPGKAPDVWSIESQEEFALLMDRLYVAFKEAGKLDKHTDEAEKWRKRMASDPADKVVPSLQAFVEKLEEAARKVQGQQPEGGEEAIA